MIKPLPPYPAALLTDNKKRTIVVADLHIGWEMALQDQGIHVPSQTPRILTNLLQLVKRYKADNILILGDVKYTVSITEKGEWHDVPDFFNGLKQEVKHIAVVRGNHDGNLEPLLPESVKILPSAGFVEDDVGFFHGHQWPSPSLLQCRTLVMGHVHPVIVFRDPAGFRLTKQVWVKLKCDTNELTRILLQKTKARLRDKSEEGLYATYGFKPRTFQLFIMPSFNDFLGGRPLNERSSRRYPKSEIPVGPILRSKAVDMNEAEVFLLDQTYLGTIGQLKNLS